MHYYIYKIINKINQKYYIGARTSRKEPFLDINYLGSGKAIKRAIKKYGKENFTKEILVICPNKEYVFNLEKLYITEDIINSVSSYNMRSGGCGGTSSSDWTEERKESCRKAAQKTYETKPEVKEKISEAVKKLFEERGVGYWSEEGFEKMCSQGAINGPKGKGKKFIRKKKIIDTSKIGRYERKETHKLASKERLLKLLEENNPMNDVENRKRVGDSKIGRRKMKKDGIGKYIKLEDQLQYELDGWIFCTTKFNLKDR